METATVSPPYLQMNIYSEFTTKGERGIKGHRKQKNPKYYSPLPHEWLSVFFKNSIILCSKAWEREPRTAWNQNIKYSCQWLLCTIGSKYSNKIFPYFHQNFPISGKGPTDIELLRDMSVLNNEVKCTVII